MNTISIDDRKDRWVRFYESDEPDFLFHVYCDEAGNNQHPRPLLWPEKKQERIDWSWNQCQRMLEASSWLDDDRIPRLSADTGTEIFAMEEVAS